jgi:tetratricopeptide (TPR) repeat protein
LLNRDSVNWMQKGLQYHQTGHLQQAQACYERSLLAQPDNYETLQLMGAVLHKQGHSLQAVDYLQRSLAIKEDQAHVVNTLGNVYKANKLFTKATQQYLLALQRKPDYLDPYINLCQLLLVQTEYEACQKLLISAAQRFPISWQLLRIRGQLASELGQYKNATDYLLKANTLAPDNVAVLHAIGLNYRLSGETEKALQFYQQIHQLGHQSESFFHNYGNALSDASDNGQALEYYSFALQLNPVARETLVNWCDLMWESGHSDNMFAAYSRAVMEQSVGIEIYADYIKKLLRTNMLDLAKQIIMKMEQKFAGNSLTQVLNLLLLRAENDVTTEIGNLSSIFLDADLLLDDKLGALEYMLERGEYQYVLNQLQFLQKDNPTNQWLLALLHTCSRIIPEQEFLFHHLADYVFEYTMLPPDELTMTEFIAQLSAYLLTLHNSKEQPLEQTLHKGTQTKGNLFDNEHRLLVHIQNQYKQAVLEYKRTLAHLPEIYTGFWQDNATEFSGSWSVALQQSGFHNYHIHPMGWLSSACYVALPDISDLNNHGYLQVGVPNLAKSGLNLAPLKEIRPEVGKLVLFPSMLWHGTVPFNENATRLSIACDIVYTNMGE